VHRLVSWPFREENGVRHLVSWPLREENEAHRIVSWLSREENGARRLVSWPLREENEAHRIVSWLSRVEKAAPQYNRGTHRLNCRSIRFVSSSAHVLYRAHRLNVASVGIEIVRVRVEIVSVSHVFSPLPVDSVSLPMNRAFRRYGASARPPPEAGKQPAALCRSSGPNGGGPQFLTFFLQPAGLKVLRDQPEGDTAARSTPSTYWKPS